jgi:hypothetical protein
MGRYIAVFPAEARKLGRFSGLLALTIDGTACGRHDQPMYFEIPGHLSNIETFAAGSGIREIARLRRVYGRGRWRKRKGVA